MVHCIFLRTYRIQKFQEFFMRPIPQHLFFSIRSSDLGNSPARRLFKTIVPFCVVEYSDYLIVECSVITFRISLLQYFILPCNYIFRLNRIYTHTCNRSFKQMCSDHMLLCQICSFLQHAFLIRHVLLSYECTKRHSKIRFHRFLLFRNIGFRLLFRTESTFRFLLCAAVPQLNSIDSSPFLTIRIFIHRHANHPPLHQTDLTQSTFSQALAPGFVRVMSDS